MSNKGDMRINCGVDHLGDYYASVEMYMGWMRGWKRIKRYWAVSARTPQEAYTMAERFIEQNKDIKLGVVSYVAV